MPFRSPPPANLLLHHQERTFFGNYIKGKGMEVVMDPQRDGDMVTLLLDFRARLQFVLENSFASHSRFNQAIKDAFEHFINARQNRPAELIAKFADANLRAGNKVRARIRRQRPSVFPGKCDA